MGPANWSVGSCAPRHKAAAMAAPWRRLQACACVRARIPCPRKMPGAAPWPASNCGGVRAFPASSAPPLWPGLHAHPPPACTSDSSWPTASCTTTCASAMCCWHAEWELLRSLRQGTCDPAQNAERPAANPTACTLLGLERQYDMAFERVSSGKLLAYLRRVVKMPATACRASTGACAVCSRR